jgi:hypothetical protein
MAGVGVALRYGLPLTKAVWKKVLDKFKDPVIQQIISVGLVTAEQIHDEFTAEYPESDERTIDEAVTMFQTVTDAEVLRPFYRRGPNRGQPIIPFYYTANLTNGNAWFHQHYYSKPSMDASFKRGRKFGNSEARNEMVKTKDILGGS